MERDKTRKVLQFNKQNQLTIVEKEKESASDKESEKAHFFSLLNTSVDSGFTIVLPIVGGSLLGAYLDKIWYSAPKATLSLMFIGIILGVASMIRLFRDSNREDL